MAISIHAFLSPLNLAFLAGVAYLVHRIYFELTIGAKRRRMIAEHGCKEPWKYPHKGFMGKLMGMDVLKELVRSGKEGNMHETNRLRNFSNGIKTLQSRRLFEDSITTIEPENVKTVSRMQNHNLPTDNIRYSPQSSRITAWGKQELMSFSHSLVTAFSTQMVKHGSALEL